MTTGMAIAVTVRPLRREDLPSVVRIDGLHTGEPKPGYWRDSFDKLLRDRPPQVGLAAEADSEVIGYLLGEVRAFEFGAEACGWVFAVGVDPEHSGVGVASSLLAEACRRFREDGVDRVRTMVRRNDVPVLSFFRRNGFVGGPFTQLELALEDGA